MKMYATVNVENLRLYDPTLIYDQGDHVQIPSIDDLSPKYLSKLYEDTILIERSEIQNEGMWNTFMLVSKEKIQEKINGLRLES
jgi:hypothetical protein